MDFKIKNKTVILCGKRCSGKSQLMRYILIKSKHLFKKVFVICPTEEINHFYKGLVNDENIFESYKEQWVENLMKRMGVENDGKKDNEASHILLILDDCCSDSNFHQSKTLKQLFTKGRHYKITIVILCQYPYHVPPICRVNCDFIAVGQLNTQGIQILTQEFLMGNINKKDFLKLYYNSTNNYKFLLINNNSSSDNNNLDEIYAVLRCPEKYIKK
jgi:hypothetical protein